MRARPKPPHASNRRRAHPLDRRRSKVSSPNTPHARTAVDARALCAELSWEGYRQRNVRRLARRGQDGHRPRAAGRARRAGPPLAPQEDRISRDGGRSSRRVRTGARAARRTRGTSAPARFGSVLPAGYAALLVIRRLERELLPALRRLFPRFEHYPLPAQRALVEMANNLGVGGLRRFFNLIAACNRGDFAAAADHCHRRTVGVARNTATRALFRKAANLPIG